MRCVPSLPKNSLAARLFQSMLELSRSSEAILLKSAHPLLMRDLIVVKKPHPS